MHILKRNSVLSAAVIALVLLMSVMSSIAWAGDGSGGGHNAPLLEGACLATIANNASTAGEQLGDNMKLASNPPTIRLQLATNIADDTVWNTNENCIKLYNSSHSIVSANVSRIDPNLNFAERNYIFVNPSAVLAPGSYTITIAANLTSKNGVSAGREQSVSFSVAGNTGNNSNDTGITNSTGSSNGTGSSSNTGSADSNISNDTGSPSNSSSDVILKDITGNWAAANINKLVESGVIKGYPDGTFKPNKTITRAEFVTIIVHAFNLEPQTGKVFKDTSNHWGRDYIATAAGCGIISGYNTTTFGPDDNITREQMAVIIDKALHLQNINGGQTFTDQAQISSWAKDAVIRASQNGLISGYPDNTFRPGINATRAEAVTIITNALSKANQ